MNILASSANPRLIEGMMKQILIAVAGVMISTLTAQAQSPVPAGSGRNFNVSFGYSYFSLGPPPANRFGLNGADASFTLELLRRFGVKVDVGYGHTSNVLAHGSHSDVLSYVGGPVFYPRIRKHYAAYVEGLIGGAFVRSTLIPTGGPAQIAWVNHLSWGYGSGVEFLTSSPLALRLGADYMHTTFYNGSLTYRGQNDLRATASIVFYFGQSWIERW